jgi:hypothetical protein
MKKFYYYDEENDFLEYIDGSEDFFAKWINPHLTLLFPHDCTELIPKNIIGFNVMGLQYLIKNAKEQADIPLTPEQRKEIDKMLKDIN